MDLLLDHYYKYKLEYDLVRDNLHLIHMNLYMGHDIFGSYKPIDLGIQHL